MLAQRAGRVRRCLRKLALARMAMATTTKTMVLPRSSSHGRAARFARTIMKVVDHLLFSGSGALPPSRRALPRHRQPPRRHPLPSRRRMIGVGYSAPAAARTRNRRATSNTTKASSPSTPRPWPAVLALGLSHHIKAAPSARRRSNRHTPHVDHKGFAGPGVLHHCRNSRAHPGFASPLLSSTCWPALCETERHQSKFGMHYLIATPSRVE